MKLVIISHTEHYQYNGKIVGWGPTVREIDYLSNHFESITHLACFYQGVAPLSSLPYQSNNVRFVPIPGFGGPGLFNKIRILTCAPSIIRTVFRELRTADAFQFRTPTSMGVYLIPILTLFTKKHGWYKYAGNWVQKKPPLSYRFQRWCLSKMQHRTVTINGKWENQPAHCISFENPCLDDHELELGQSIVSNKIYAPPFEVCFVGRVETEKGVGEIIHATRSIDRSLIKKIWIVGDGPERNSFEQLAKSSQTPFEFTGFLPRTAIVDIYKRCHFILLPSHASEGFPKVLAEAMNYGCLPISSSVSAIPQFVQYGITGFLWHPEKETFVHCLQHILNASRSVDFHQTAENARNTALRFSFRHYLKRICAEILK